MERTQGDIKEAIETHELLYQIFLKYGQIPEAFTHRFEIHWGQYPLRPEFAESTYLLYKGFALNYIYKVRPRNYIGIPRRIINKRITFPENIIRNKNCEQTISN